MANKSLGRETMILTRRKWVGRDPSDILLTLRDSHEPLLRKLIESAPFALYREQFRFGPDTGWAWALRWMIENRLVFLLKEVMGMDWMGDFHIHGETGMLRMYEKAQSCGRYNRILSMWPRGYGKSTYLTVGGTIQRILKNPEMRVGIGSWRVDLAEKFVFAISEELMGNDIIRELYPDVIWDSPKQSPRWTVQKGLQVIRKSRDKDPSIMPFSIFNLPTGSHMHILCLDDIVTLENADSDAMQRQVDTALKNVSNFLTSPHDPIHWTGTTYGFNDAVNKAKEDRNWLLLFRNCWEPGLAWKKASYPERYDIPELAQKYKEDGPYSFAANMELTPVIDSDRTLRAEWLTEVKYVPPDIDLYMGVDLAFTSGKNSDRSAILVAGITPSRTKLYLVDGIVLKAGIEEVIQYLVSLGKQYQHKIIMAGIELISGAQGIEPSIRQALIEANVPLPITVIKGYSQTTPTKNVRIESFLAPIMSRGDIVLTRQFKDAHPDMELRVYPELIQEINQFKRKGHDDILDAIVDILMVCPPLGNHPEKYKINEKRIDRKDFLRILSSKGHKKPIKPARHSVSGRWR